MFFGKLRASLSPLFYGGNATSKLFLLNRFNARQQTSDGSRFISSFSVGGGVIFESREIRLPYHRLHTSAPDEFSELDEPEQEDAEAVENPEQKFSYLEDDDEWSQLGSVKKEKIVIPKLMTEKPEPLRKSNGKRRASALGSLLVKNASTAKGLSPNQVVHLPLKDVESRKRALVAGRVSLKNANLKIQPAETGRLIRIRISNLNLETADSAIHSMCTSFGLLEGLARVDEDTVDALFRVRDSSVVESIINKLNNTTVDDFLWSAKLQSGVPTPARVTKPEISQDQMGLRIRSCMEDLHSQILMIKVHVKDLELLLHSVLHLKNHPIAKRD